MKDKNVFYIKNIVDGKITEETPRVKTQKIVEETKNAITLLSNDDFIEVMIGCFIPDTYKDQGKKEKLYTKLSELVVGEWWRRMGGTYILPTKICGNCGNIYSRVKYTTRAGTKITKWRCGSCNKADGHKVCSNRYVTDETFTKLFVMGWNEIVEHQADYQERWQENIKGDDVLLRYKTKLVMKHAAAGVIEEFDSALMMAVMDHITVYEDGRLQIKFYDGTEFEVATE